MSGGHCSHIKPAVFSGQFRLGYKVKRLTRHKHRTTPLPLPPPPSSLPPSPPPLNFSLSFELTQSAISPATLRSQAPALTHTPSVATGISQSLYSAAASLSSSSGGQNIMVSR
ncbi:hypothetical protein R3P38DRAFT_2794696 [Favolaschia claudopus]|uniref:Uncharacterized protein n=1 Tax=Favolaschia claudopus TaxID=2862362 RepID=A0AAW0A8T2_9AGAR